MSKPHFIIKNRFQKGAITYCELLKPEILTDVCKRITGRTDYTVEWDDEGYNKGRMAILRYADQVNYISFSEIENNGRNSFFQSVPSALNQCIMAEKKSSRPFYYFLPIQGEYQSNYYRFMYRLLNTAGVKFLNADEFLDNAIRPFVSVDDLILAREANRNRNRSNNSTYITPGNDGSIQIYAKVYGANKYESELLALALRRLTPKRMELFEIKEGDLTELPAISRQVLSKVCGRQLTITLGDVALERREFECNDSLRSPRYVYNLLDRFGPKKCALCDCDIPEIIQASHIWGVAQIKKQENMSIDEKIGHVVNRHNGLWLCENHHKLFDTNIIRILENGRVQVQNRLTATQQEFIASITPSMSIPSEFISNEFVNYLRLRYAS